MTAPAKEMRGSVEKIERKEPPEPEGYILLTWDFQTNRWSPWPTVDLDREQAIRYADGLRLAPHLWKIIHISPAPPEPKAEAGSDIPYLLNGLGSVAQTIRGEEGRSDLAEKIEECVWMLRRELPAPPAASVGAVPVGAIGRIVENARPDLGYPYPFKRADDCEAVRSWLSSLDQPKARAEGADVEPCPFCGEAAEVRTDKPSRPPEYMTDREAQANGLGVSGGWLNLPVTEASCRACGVMRVPLSIWNKRSLPAPAPKASAATREAVYNAELFLHDSACKWLCSDDPLGECNCERRAVVMALRRALGIGDF